MTLGAPIPLVVPTGFKKLVMKLLSISTVPCAEPANKLESCSGIPPQVRASLILALVISLFSISVLPPCKGIPSCPTLLILLLSIALAKEKPVIESPTMLAALKLAIGGGGGSSFTMVKVGASAATDTRNRYGCNRRPI